MRWIAQNLWLVPALPVLAAGLSALVKQRHRSIAASLAIGSMALSCLLSLLAFASVMLAVGHPEQTRQVFNFPWFQFGSEWLQLGWILDPLTAVMLVMVTFVGLLIFIYSVGYMAHDENFTRFFCFLSLFAGAMLVVVIANSLLLLFIGWELVGLTSYLLIGFWYYRPSAAAAAKKAFITTRIGDLAFLIGMVWLYSQAGTLLFYDGGAGCMEQTALLRLAAQTTSIGMAASTAIALLIFCGAAGKSGQVPLHVWLPDAMEGPTPVSALIHAATMVAAGVFLVARVFPLMSIHAPSLGTAGVGTAGLTALLTPTTALKVITWTGAVTAIFAAGIAVAQNDIKRILAYSTVSQLGYMMMGLGVGGVAIGMFHLITHAFFKSLLFMGAGSVIHGCHDQQDIRRMGGLRYLMPVTFAAYAVGMLALCGFPLLFSGFWSKDEILHAASLWSVSRIPFYLGVAGALLTAFYMTRQVCYVFFGDYLPPSGNSNSSHAVSTAGQPVHTFPLGQNFPIESPAVMLVPLAILAVAAILLGIFGTPLWPWFHAFLSGEKATWNPAGFFENGILSVMLTSSLVVFLGLGLGWKMYGRREVPADPVPTGPVSTDPVLTHLAPDALERLQPQVFAWLQHAFYVDQLYAATILRFHAWSSVACDWLDRRVWNGAVQAVSYGIVGLSKLDNLIDNQIVNRGFDSACSGAREGGGILSRLQNGRTQSYLRIAGAAMVVLIIFLMWGGRR